MTDRHRPSRPADVPRWVTGVPLAHRGLHDGPAALEGTGVVENTLASFTAAVDASVGIELDVHLTRDGTAIVHHDYTLERVCGVPARLARVRTEDLLSLPARVRPPALEQVLGLVAGCVPLMIEVKPQPPARRRRLRAVVSDLIDDYAGPVVVASFDPQVVGWFARRRPRVLRAQAAGADSLPTWARRASEAAGIDRWTRPHIVSHNVDQLPASRVTRARRIGIPVLVWTVGTATQLATARRYADNVIFELWDRSDPLSLDGIQDGDG